MVGRIRFKNFIVIFDRGYLSFNMIEHMERSGGKYVIRAPLGNTIKEVNEKLKVMKKNGELTEDDLKQAEKKTQDATDKFIKEIDKIAEKKKQEIMEI